MPEVALAVRQHDANTADVYATVRGALRGVDPNVYSVLVPWRMHGSAEDRNAFWNACVDLAALVEHRHPFVVNIVVPAGLWKDARAVMAYRPPIRRAIEYRHVAAPFGRLGAEYDFRYAKPTPTAEERARTLLREIDPELAKKMEGGKAFYFTTPLRRYIWYPTTRAILSLEDDEPKYVCIHSRDSAVELNPYDWALTMRTYILADEAAWRKKANFHSEFYVRGAEEAHATRDIYPGDSAGGSRDVHERGRPREDS